MVAVVVVFVEYATGAWLVEAIEVVDLEGVVVV